MLNPDNTGTTFSPATMQGPPPDMNLPESANIEGIWSDPNMIEGQAASVHHGRLSGILNNVANILGGGSQTLRLRQNKDGSVDVEQVEGSPKEKWGRIAAAALSGAAAGFANGQGPGGPARAFAAGVGTGTKQVQDRQDEARRLAKDYTTQNQQAQLFKANMALQNQRIIGATFDNIDKERVQGEAEADRALNIIKTLDSMHASKAAHVKNMDDVAAYYNSTPELQQAHHDGRLFTNPVYENGKLTGVDVYTVPVDQMQKLYDKKIIRTRIESDPTDPMKKPTVSTYEVPANTMTVEKAMLMMQEDTDNNNKTNNAYYQRVNEAKETQQKEGLVKAQIESAKANAAESYAGAELHKAQANVLNSQARPGGTPQAASDPEFVPLSNFNAGTPGIRLDKRGQPDLSGGADVFSADRVGQIMADSANNIRQILKNDPQILGRMNGLLSEGKTLIGLSNDKSDLAISALAGAMQQYAATNASFHRYRNKWVVEDTERAALNKFRNSPEAVMAYLDTQQQAVSDTHREAMNYQHYGTPNGPTAEDRATAFKKAPNYDQLTGYKPWPVIAPNAGTVWVQAKDPNTGQMVIGAIPTNQINDFKAKHPEAMIQTR
jgi:hypothetical protein